MTARDRAANACRESFNLYDEDYRGDPTTLVAALESDFDPMLETDDTCKRSIIVSKKAAPMISKCVRWRLKPHAA